MNESKELKPVVQYSVADVLYERKRQPIVLRGCVIKMNVAKFYGTYALYDDKGRLLARSEDGSISFKRTDLQTEEAKVWYDSIAGYSEEYKELTQMVKDPGLCFSYIRKVFIEFEDAPEAEKEPNRRFNHIHVIYTVNSIWNDDEKVLKF